MLEDTSSASHWHDNDYQLEPHRLQVREITRQPGAVCFLHSRNVCVSSQAGVKEQSLYLLDAETELDGGAQSADDVVPVLLGGDGVNKKKAPLRCSVS